MKNLLRNYEEIKETVIIWSFNNMLILDIFILLKE